MLHVPRVIEEKPSRCPVEVGRIGKPAGRTDVASVADERVGL